jgi:AbiJ N-terminal domain 4
VSILETFSKRQKRLENKGKQNIYRYEDFPQPFRVQLIRIWESAIGQYMMPSIYGVTPSPAARFWKFIHDTLAREHGVFALANGFDTPDVECKTYVLRADTAGTLDIIELSFRVIDRVVRELNVFDGGSASITQTADDAIEELNHRFREHGLGFQFMGGIIVRLDSEFLHSQVCEPALSLLNSEDFNGPADEFLGAFEHYRHGRKKEAVADALKALESTMKAICTKRRWDFSPHTTAKPLLDILFAKGLIPAELASHFAGLRSALESGLPTISNRTSRHGQGINPIELPGHVAAYALHLTAADIVFLIEADKAMK